MCEPVELPPELLARVEELAAGRTWMVGSMRGHPIVGLGVEHIDEWVFLDTGEPICERPCTRCGRLAEPDGPDPCLGLIPGVAGACCGHGVTEPLSYGYIIFENGTRLRVEVEL